MDISDFLSAASQLNIDSWFVTIGGFLASGWLLSQFRRFFHF